MYPDERSLVKQHADQPFALLGVNSDRDRRALKQTLKKESITWRSWWDAGSINGPIQTQWQVARRPVVYVLDPKGVIHFKGEDTDGVDEIVAALLKEAVAGSKQK